MQTEANQIMPVTLQEKLEMANVFVKSNLMPRGLDRPEKVVIALEMGHELGLPPLIAIMNIAVINNLPTLKADMMVALALRSGKIVDIRINYIGNEHENDDDFGCRVTIKRKGIKTLFKSTFTRRDAKVACLAHKDNWRKYERRMLKHRAIAFCIRDAIPEIFAGVYIPDELDNLPENKGNKSIVIKPDQFENDKPKSETTKQSSSESQQTSTSNQKEDKITKQQETALRELSEKIFSPGIVESYLYDKYEVNKIENLSSVTAGKLILILQNDPGVIHDWVERTYQNAS